MSFSIEFLWLTVQGRGELCELKPIPEDLISRPVLDLIEIPQFPKVMLLINPLAFGLFLPLKSLLYFCWSVTSPADFPRSSQQKKGKLNKTRFDLAQGSHQAKKLHIFKHAMI